MKKFLSVLLAVMMVVSTAAMAVPFAVTENDTADENKNDQPAADANLAAGTYDIYNVRYFALGNSYLKYNYSSEVHVDWWMRHSEGGINDPRGMAASTSANDYFHKIQEYVKADLEGTAEVVFEAEALSIAGPEKAWQYDGLGSDYASYDYTKGANSVDSNAALNAAMSELAAYNPNVVTLQIGENTGFNASNDCRPIAAWFYDKIVGKIREAAPNAIIVVVTVFEPSVVYNGICDANSDSKYTNFKESNKVFISDNSDMVIPTWMINSYPEYSHLKDQLGTTSNELGIVDYRYNHPYLAYSQYKEYDQVMLENSGATDFRGHPGDEGMAEIGRRAATVLSEKIPLYLTPEKITIPDTLGTIYHDRTTNDDGQAVIEGSSDNVQGKFYLMPSEITPSDASKDVVWTIENEEIATGVISTEVSENSAALGIKELFVVTPKHNGTTKITVASKYDANVKAEIEIEVKGRTPHYTLTYDLGASDAVNCPEPYGYAAGDYVFPAPTVRPTRPGFKFAGWSLTPGGAAVESVYMNEDTTVYAVWEFAHDWQFNTDGDTEGIQTTGMHGKAEGGYFIAETYESGAGSISATDLRIPSNNFQRFKTRMSLSEVKSGDKMVLVVGTVEDSENYTYEVPLTSTELTEYSFDLSDIKDKTIDYFMVGSSNASISANRITVDYATFVETGLIRDQNFGAYTVSGVSVFNAGDYKYTFESITIDSGATLQLGAGNYYIGSFTNNGSIVASPNANVIFGSGAPTNYVTINIGTKQMATGRYAEVDGYEIKLAEGETYGMLITGDADKLLQIKDGSQTKVYLVDVSAKSYSEVAGLSDYMKSTGVAKEFGVDGGKYGAKFEAEIAKANKIETSAYNITEYGFIVSLDELLGTQQLNFDLDPSKYEYGAAYQKGVSDKVVDDASLSNAAKNDGFRAVIYGAPATGYGKKLVVKTYTRVTINGQNFVIYGPTQYESFYSLASKLGDDNEIAKAIKDAVTGGNKEPSLDFGDLIGG